MRRLSASYIFTGKEILHKGIIELNSENEIINVIDTKGILKEQESLEYYNGAIVPGFINAHCHLELSHMKGVINNETVKGLPGFIDEIISKRSFPENLEEKIQKADFEMQLNGIVAVGDISNTDDSFAVKKSSKLHYNTFVECFSTDKNTAINAFKIAEDNVKKLQKLELTGTIVPHAAYSVPNALYDNITEFNKKEAQIISIHNQETPSEDSLIRNQSGELASVLKKKGFNFTDFSFQGNTALESTLLRSDKKDNLLLIHNTFSSLKDIDLAENFSDNIYWVFCPLSNLYIEKTLPDLPMFFEKGIKACFGTDSYASNTELSILSELKVAIKAYPEIPFEKLIEAACLTGAKALKIDKTFGSIEIGKKPGINLINDFDFELMTLKKSSKIKVLV